MPKEQKDAKKYTFIMSDERVNCYGYRVLTAGIDLTVFKTNPIALYCHNRTNGREEWLPVGKWSNLRKEEGKLLGDLEFDQNDEFALKIESKVENGFLNTCSIWVDVIKMSEDEADMLPGQQYPTFTKTKLMECSIVDMPGNVGATRLSHKGTTLQLSAGNDAEIQDFFNQHKETKMNKLQQALIVLLALDASASEEQVADAVKALQQKAKDQEAEALLVRKNAIESTLSAAQKEGKITAEERKEYETLAAVNFESVQKLLAAKAPAQKLSEQLRTSGTSTADVPAGGCRFDQLSKTNPEELKRIAREEPAEYDAIVAEKRTLSRQKYNHKI
jgi:hypothetical protein